MEQNLKRDVEQAELDVGNNIKNSSGAYTADLLYFPTPYH